MNGLSIVIGADRPDLVRDETLPELFREAVHKFADRPALIFRDESLSYTELDRWSDAVAAYLAKNGIGRSAYVGVWWQRGLELHAIILGIAKAGATYVPVDREIPAERVEVILEEVGAAACFSLQKLNAACPMLNIPEKSQRSKVSPPAGGGDPISIGLEGAGAAAPIGSDCAYVLYTSGSTGKPKGIPISHRQICHLVRSEQTVLQILPTDKVYQGFSVSFDMWCEETWISYFAGATLWVADNTTSKAVDELSDILKKENITILHAVPSLLAVMDDNIPSLRLVNAGGEACTAQVLAKWCKPGIRFYNSYGPTETTVTATMAALGPGDPIVIGDPLPNYNLAVVNELMNPVPVGEAGELVITGPGVSSGYVKLPQLTKEKFIPKPASLAALPGSVVYRTGDIAVVNPDGSVAMQGRIDDQIKLRGYRIELGEIETKLNEIAGVASAAAAVKKDNLGNEHLVGYVVTEGLACIEENLFRIELSKSLPSYMVPATIMVLPEMPRMPSGKINRKGLPVPASLMLDSDTASETLDLNAPVPDRIMAVLHKIFLNRTIDPSMDFFTDLGGHSLLAAGLVSQLRRDAGLPNASLKDVYIHRPLSNLIAVWSERRETKVQPKRVFNKIPPGRYLACWAAQTVSLLVIYGLF